MAFGAKVKLSVNKTGARNFRNEIQKFVDDSTTSNPIRIKNIKLELNKSQQTQLRRNIQEYLNASGDNLTIKINKIDASGAVKQLRSQLETMLSGLSITGLKDFLGTEGIESTYERAAVAADKLATAQENVKRKSEEVNASVKVLKTLQNNAASAYTHGNKITNVEQVTKITNDYKLLCTQIEKAKALEGEEQQIAIQGIATKTAALRAYIDEIYESESASKRSAASEASNTESTIVGLTKISALYKRISNYAAANPKVMNNGFLGGQINNWLSKLSTVTELPSDEFQSIEKGFAGITIEARKANLEGKTFGDVVKSAYQKFGGWTIITRTLTFAIQKFKQMISVVTQLDTAMTELRKVTDLTDKAYDEFFDRATKRAKELGATIVDTISATADFARLGFTVAEAEKLADAAIIYKNVGDGIEDINAASSSIISTMKAFGIQATDSMSIVDKFNEVGNNFAISSKGIGDALQRSSAALAAAGNTLDESIALAVGMNSVIQDPEKVGTVLKTASMYLRAAKTEAEEAGESTEGMANSVSALRNELLTLTHGKVDIMLDDTTFKSTIQIYRELAAVWDDLADVDAANILELIGGKRNATANAALLSNFEDVEEALATSANSVGSAFAENEKYLESIQGKLSLLKSTAEDFSSSLIDSELVKFFVDFGTKAIEILDRLVDSMGSLGAAAAITAVALNRKFGIYSIDENGQMRFDFKSKPVEISDDVKGIFDAYDIMKNEEGLNLSTDEMWEFADGLEGADKNLKAFLDSEEYAEKTFDNFNKYMQKQNSGLRALGRSFKNFAKSIAIDIAIMNTIRAVSELITLFSSLGEEEKTVFDEFDELSSELSTVRSDLNSLESELSNVEDQMDALLSKGELSFTDKEELSRLRGISNELKQQIKLSETLEESLQKSVNDTALNAYTIYADNTSFYSKETKAERKKEAESIGSTIGNVAGLIIGTVVAKNPMVGAAIGSTLGSVLGGIGGNVYASTKYDSEATVGEMLDRMALERATLTKAQEEAREAYNQHRSASNKEDWEAATQALNDYNTALANHIGQLSEYYNAVDYASLKTESERDDYRKMGDDIDKYNIEMGVAGAKTVALERIFDEEQMTDDVRKFKEAVSYALESGEDIRFYDIDSDEHADAIAYFQSLNLSVTDAIAHLKDLKEAEEEAADYETYDMVSSIAELSAGVQELKDAFEEFNKEGILTAETLVKLNALFGSLGDEWKSYVDIMTSGGASPEQAAEATEKLAEGYLDELLKNGAFNLDDTEGFKAYLTAINQLELIGVENAKQYIDALQQQAMVQEAVDKIIADSDRKKTLEAKENRTDAEQEELDALNSKSTSDYISEIESKYGTKITDTSLIEKQKEFDEMKELAKDYDDFSKKMEGKLDDYETSAEAWKADSVNMKKWQDAIDDMNELAGYESDSSFAPVGKRNEQAWEALKDIFGADTKYDDYDRAEADADAIETLYDDAVEHRQELFDEMLEVAKDAGIDLSDIDIDAFDPLKYGDGSIFTQVYDRIQDELKNTNYGELADKLEKELNEAFDDVGLEVNLDLDLQGIELDKLQSASSGISSLQKAFKELSDDGYVTISTLSQIKEAAGLSGDTWGYYQNELMNAKIGSEEYNQVMSDLTYAMFEEKFTTEQLASANEDYIAAVLRENGVLNANAVAHDILTRAQRKQEIQAILNKGVTDDNINALITNATACGTAKNAYLELVAQEIAFNNNDLDVSEKIAKLNQIAVAAGVAGIEMDNLNSKFGSQEARNQYAKDNNITVGTDKGFVPFFSFDDKTTYTLPTGETTDDFSEAYAQTEAQKLIDRINNSTQQVKVQYTDVGSGSSSKKKSKFEQEYDYHQHLLKMNQESDEEYLAWLSSAYVKAYESGQIELEDFYKYQEEVYEKSKELFDDYIKDIEHQIEMINNSNSKISFTDETYLPQNISDKIIAHYRDIQNQLHIQAEQYRAQGLDENHELIQDLQKQWWDAEEKIADTISSVYSKVITSVGNSIDLEKNHLNDYVTVHDDGSAEEFSNSIVSKYKIIQDKLHEEANALRALGYAEDSKEIQDLQKQWWDAENNKNDSLREIYDRRLEQSEDYIERSKALGWENGDNEIKARERILKWMSTDYYKSLFSSQEEWQEAFLEELGKYNDSVMSTIDKIYNRYSEAIGRVNEELDNQIKRERALLDVSSKQYDAINKLADAQHEADKAIADSRIAKAYLNEREYALIYNEEDYSTISRIIDNLDSDITALTKNFNKQIEYAYANGQEYLIENITAEYERQVELKMQELAIAEAELEVTKKQTELNNVLAERNVRQLTEKDGKLQWEWVADIDKVRAATEALSDAEYKYQRAIDEKNQQLSLDQMQENIDDFSDEQARNNKLVEELGDTIDDVKNAIDDIENPIEGLTVDIKTLKEKGVVNFSKAIDSMVAKLSSVAISSASNAKQTANSGFSSSSYSWGSGGSSSSRVTYDSSVDYMAQAQSAIARGDDKAAANYLAKRDAKIDGEGLSYKKESLSDVKKKMGYASGTTNATKGWHEVDENGGETYITTDGKFHNFEGGEYVFDNEQTRRLWELSKKFSANISADKLSSVYNNLGIDDVSKVPAIKNTKTENSYAFGDIVIQNPANFDDFVKQLTNTVRKKTV